MPYNISDRTLICGLIRSKRADLARNWEISTLCERLLTSALTINFADRAIEYLGTGNADPA